MNIPDRTITLRELRDHLDDLCSQGKGDAPVKKVYDGMVKYIHSTSDLVHEAAPELIEGWRLDPEEVQEGDILIR